jgi:hypothetical protein
MATATEKIPAVDYFDVHLTIDYFRMEIPPRCRKPRPVDHQTEGVWRVPVVDPADAPVVFTIAPAFEDDVRGPRVIRQVAGQLYAPENHRVDQGPTVPGSDVFPDHRAVELEDASQIADEDLVAEAADSRGARDLGGSLVIDGEVWTPVGEPRYTVMTFGVGNNHGGTDISVKVDDNSNIGGDSYFRADAYEAALSEAISTAKWRGDTEDVARWETEPDQDRRITVHDRSAVKLVTPPVTPWEIYDARWDYRSKLDDLSRARSPEAEASLFAEVCALRRKIVDAGFSPVATDVRPYEDR